jgi:xanthine/uracil permease
LTDVASELSPAFDKTEIVRESVRPSDLIYGLDDQPPVTRLLMLAFQHVAVICPYRVFVTLILQQAHASVAVATSAVSLAMLGIALMTVLQAQRLGWIGSGFLAPPVVSAIYFAPPIHAIRGGQERGAAQNPKDHDESKGIWSSGV